MQLASAVEERKKYLINQLAFYGYDPTGLNNLTLTQLENEYIRIKCEIGREMTKIEED